MFRSARFDLCGTTFSDFQNAHGELGSYQAYLNVYGREGEPCRLCATAVMRLTQAQRSTFYCPTCQAEPRVTVRGHAKAKP